MAHLLPEIRIDQAISPKNQLLFASDFHLGAPHPAASRQRELKVLDWMREHQDHTRALFLVGDVFDFWHEYRHVVPKGHVRLLGKLAEWVEHGIDIHLFTGNHDLWMFGYLEQEIGLQIHRGPRYMQAGGQHFYLAHGDGLGPGDHGYKMLKRLFTNRFCQWVFRQLHPDWGIGMAYYFSRTSRRHTGCRDACFLGPEKEWLILHSNALLRSRHFDYFIYGHRHYPVEWPLTGPDGRQSRYLNLGDWIRYFSYASFDGQNLELQYYTPVSVV